MDSRFYGHVNDYENALFSQLPNEEIKERRLKKSFKKLAMDALNALHLIDVAVNRGERKLEMIRREKNWRIEANLRDATNHLLANRLVQIKDGALGDKVAALYSTLNKIGALLEDSIFITHAKIAEIPAELTNAMLTLEVWFNTHADGVLTCTKHDDGCVTVRAAGTFQVDQWEHRTGTWRASAPTLLQALNRLAEENFRSQVYLPKKMEGNARQFLEQAGAKFVTQAEGSVNIYAEAVNLPVGWKLNKAGNWSSWAFLTNQFNEHVVEIFMGSDSSAKLPYLRLTQR